MDNVFKASAQTFFEKSAQRFFAGEAEQSSGPFNRVQNYINEGIKDGAQSAINTTLESDEAAEWTATQLRTTLDETKEEIRTKLQAEATQLPEQDIPPQLFNRFKAALSKPEDGFLKRICNNLLARVLNWGAGVSALLGANLINHFSERIFKSSDEEAYLHRRVWFNWVSRSMERQAAI